MKYTEGLLNRYKIVLKEIRNAFPSMSHEWAANIAFNILQALSKA